MKITTKSKFLFKQRLMILIALFLLTFSLSVNAKDGNTSDTPNPVPLTPENIIQEMSEEEAKPIDVTVVIETVEKVTKPDIPLSDITKIPVESTDVQIDEAVKKIDKDVEKLTAQTEEPVVVSVTGNDPSYVSKVVVGIVNGGLIGARGVGNFVIAYTGSMYYGNAYNSWLGAELGAGVYGAVILATSMTTQFLNPVIQKFLNAPSWANAMLEKKGVKVPAPWNGLIETVEGYFKYGLVSGTSLAISTASTFIVGINKLGNLDCAFLMNLGFFFGVGIATQGTAERINASFKAWLTERYPQHARFIQVISNAYTVLVGLAVAVGNVAAVNGNATVAITGYGATIGLTALSYLTSTVTRHVFKVQEQQEGAGGFLGRFCRAVRRLLSGGSKS